MTMRLDIVTNDAGELVRLEHARDMGAATVQAVYRLVKLVQFHDMSNQAFQRQLEQTYQAVTEYGVRAGAHFNVLFASRAVFVGGQLLKGSRIAYEMATELGEFLEWCGGSDFTIMRDVTMKEVELFAEAVGTALRGAKGGAAYRQPSPKIRLRQVTDAARFRGLEIEPLTFEQRVVRTYASAVVILRRFFADLTTSRYVLPRRIKRVAQSLVDLSDGSTPAFLGVTDVRNQNFDDAGRAVNTAILAVSMARELTQDRVLLAQIAMAAMMHDVGRPRAAALGEGGPRMPGAVRLSEDAEDKLAAGTAAVLTALGRLNEPTITRTVVAFEALWLRRERYLGPIYAGARVPTIHAKILQISRRYNDLVTPEPGLPEPEPDFAVATLSQELPDDSDRTILRLLVATLNLLPAGTIVALTTKEVAEIIPSQSTTQQKGAWIRVLRDSRGAIVEDPVAIDLTAPQDAGEPVRRITRVLSIDGWVSNLHAPEEAPISSQPQPYVASPEAARPEARVELEAADPGQLLPDEAYVELEPMPIEDARVTLELLPPDDPPPPLYFEPPPPLRSEPAPPSQGKNETSPSSSSVPSIASILSLPGKSRESSIVDAATFVVSAEGSNPASGTSPSMVAQAMGRVMEEGALRADRRPRSIALFEDPMIEVVAQLEELEPTARGTLTSTPIVHVLVYMLDHRQTGTVVLREVDGRHHVLYFEDGRACVVRNGRPLALLGDGLVAAGLVSPDVLVMALEVARRNGSLLGQYLVSSGLIAAEALRIALSAQVPRKIERLVNLSPETDYAFYSGVNLIPDWAKGELFPCHPLSAILAAVRSWHDRARVRATLGRIAKQVLVFHPELDLSDFMLTGEEQSVVEAIHGSSCTLSTLYDLRVAGEDTVSSIVYTFAVTRSFAFTAAKGAPMLALPLLEEVVDMSSAETAAPLPPPPSRRQAYAPAGAGPIRSMTAMFAAVSPTDPAPRMPPPMALPFSPSMHGATQVTASPFDASAHGVTQVTVPSFAPPFAPSFAPAIAPAFEPFSPTFGEPPADPSAAETGTWRPNQVPAAQAIEPGAPSVRGARLSGSPPSLGSRENQVRKAAPRVQHLDDEDSERLVQAMADFRMAESALERNEISQADDLARRALAAEPTNPDYGALVAWTSTLSGAKDAIPLAIAKLNVILKEEALCERALLYRGRLYKRAKRTAEAVRDFSSVLDINPKHSEAAIEVRLLKMKKK